MEINAMLKTIIKREFLDNFLSFKLMACVFIAIVLVLINTFFLTRNYLDRLRNYSIGVQTARESLSKVPTYGNLELKIFKTPNPLSILVSGAEAKTGNYMILTHHKIPASLKGGSVKNEFTRVFAIFDFSSLIIYIFTLLAILLSYNSISGEKEDGMLSLILSNSVPRYKVLLGKYLGGLASTVLPLTICFIIVILEILLVGGIHLSGELFGSLVLLYLLSIFYLSSVLLIGMFVSTRTRSSFKSLIYLLAAYVVFVFVLPLAINSTAERNIKKTISLYESEVPGINKEADREFEDIGRKVKSPNIWVLSISDPSFKRDITVFHKINPKEYLDYLEKSSRPEEEVLKKYALIYHDLLRIYELRIEHIHRLQNGFLALVPPSNNLRSAEIAAGTGIDSLDRYFQQIALFWHQYVDYLERKDAFGLRYYYPFSTRELTAYERDLIKRINDDRDAPHAIGNIWSYEGKYRQEAVEYKPKIDYLNLDDLPVFRFKEMNLLEKTKNSLFNIVILIFYNLASLSLAHFSFSRYDPRREA